MKIKSISKHVLAIVLSLAVLASTLMLNTFSAFATDEGTGITYWSGVAATIEEGKEDPYAGGTGKAGDPYLISTGEQLAYLTTTCTYKNTNGKYYKLTNDIYLNDVTASDWYTNGTPNPWLFQNDEKNSFSGTLDGDGHTIYGLYINGNYYKAGLFTAIGNTVIKNLKISNSYVKSTRDNNFASVAALAGSRGAWGTLTISNCAIDDDVQIIGQTGCVGGFIGYIPGNADITTIENCYSGAKLTQVLHWHAAECLVREFVAGRKDNASAKLTIKNSYTTGSNELATSNDTTKPTFEKCYTTNADSTEAGVTVRTLAQMTGAKARVYMNALDFDNVWYTEAGKTPQLRAFVENVPTEDTELWKVWDGTVPDKRVSDGTQLWVKENVPFDGGSGTSGDPYKISTPWQLAYLCAYTNWYIEGKYFELTDDIYLNDVSNDAWMEAGNNPHSWVFSTNNNGFRSAHLNGNGHTIYGLYVNKPESFAALFGKITGTSSIENLRISKSYVNNTRNDNYSASAALVGYLHENATMTISNCVIDDSVKIINASGCVGGFIGNLGNGATINIDKCYSGAMLNQIGDWNVSQCLVRAFVGSRNDVKGATYNISNSYAASDCDLIYSGTNTVSFDKCYNTYADSTETAVTLIQKSEMLSKGLTNVLKVFPMLGNVNDDANADVDICDLVILKKFDLGREVNIDIYSSDVNNDREINGMDFAALQKYILTDATVFQ